VSRRIRLLTLVLILLPPIILGQESSEPPLRVGIVPFVGEATTYYALEAGLFERQGISIDRVPFNSGYDALSALRRGAIDLCAAAPTSVVNAAIKGASEGAPGGAGFSIIASLIESSTTTNVVVLGDRNPDDLRGATVGIPLGTAAEYFWHLFARIRGFDPVEDVILRDYDLPRLLEAALESRVDVAVFWGPYDLQLRDVEGMAARILDVDHLYTTSWLLLVRREVLETRRDTVVAYLRALLEAERVVHRDPGKVARMHSEQMNTPVDVLLRSYDRIEFDLSLTEAMLINLHQQAEWSVREGIVEGKIPDLRLYLAKEPLLEIDPDRVRLLE
jgi:NitT/TauT family transport system substrate-binding protein